MKLKLKKKSWIIALIVLVIIIIDIINPFKIISRYQLSKLKYSDSSINYIIKYGIKKAILNIEYNNFIDKNVANKEFDVNNISSYKNIKCYDDVCDVTLANALILKGYDGEEISYIFRSGDLESINELLKVDKYENIKNYLSIDYSILSYLDRYIEYKELNICTYEEAILYVNLGLDDESDGYYHEIDKFSFTMLVNKRNKLSSTFVPDNLVNFDKELCYGKLGATGNQTMVTAFINMASSLNEETNLNIYIRSAYRSYKDQETTYNDYLKLYGEKYALEHVAKPGFSEHQTGLSVDIKASSSNTFKGTKEEEWLKNNAYKYGFILRYENKYKNITGYNEELWHYRYVGLEVATYIYQEKITFDEYYIRFVGNK